jgi:hypothetical protein
MLEASSNSLRAQRNVDMAESQIVSLEKEKSKAEKEFDKAKGARRRAIQLLRNPASESLPVAVDWALDRASEGEISLPLGELTRGAEGRSLFTNASQQMAAARAKIGHIDRALATARSVVSHYSSNRRPRRRRRIRRVAQCA